MNDAFGYLRAWWLSVLLTISTVTALMAEPQGSPPPRGKLVGIGGYKLNLFSTGARGPTVVLIAGAGDFSFDWCLVQDRVSAFTKVCSYDRAGFAWSDPGPTPRTMRQDAYELYLLLKKAGVPGPYVLAGHSIGGLITRVFAEQFPGDVAGVVIVLVAGKEGEDIPTPQGASAEEWNRFWQEKKQQKSDLVQLSRNSKLVLDEKSGDHIQLDDPDTVVTAIREAVEAARQHKSFIIRHP